MTDNGWVKLHRKMLEGGMLRNSNLTAFWIWCLLKATHKLHTVYIGHQKAELQPGQFIFSRSMAVAELGLSQQTVRTVLNTLKTNQQITIKTTNKFSIITIINWATYQVGDTVSQPANQPTNQPATNQQLTSKPFIPINKNVKNVSVSEPVPPHPPPAQPQKLKFAEQVFMTQAQHDDLTKRYGPEKTKGIIATYSNRKQAKGYTSSSDYHTILDWGVAAYEERHTAKAGNATDGPVYAPAGRFKTKDKGPYECSVCRGYGTLEYEAETRTLGGKAATMSFYGYCPNCANWSAVKGDNDRAREQQPVPAQYLATAKPFTETL